MYVCMCVCVVSERVCMCVYIKKRLESQTNSHSNSAFKHLDNRVPNYHSCSGGTPVE